MDYEMTLERMPERKRDRVKLVTHGKFLPYRKVLMPAARRLPALPTSERCRNVNGLQGCGCHL
ncbi:MAG: hypothetical protein ACJ78X_21295 [Myxococcales bacterium]